MENKNLAKIFQRAVKDILTPSPNQRRLLRQNYTAERKVNLHQSTGGQEIRTIQAPIPPPRPAPEIVDSLSSEKSIALFEADVLPHLSRGRPQLPIANSVIGSPSSRDSGYISFSSETSELTTNSYLEELTSAMLKSINFTPKTNLNVSSSILLQSQEENWDEPLDSEIPSASSSSSSSSSYLDEANPSFAAESPVSKAKSPFRIQSSVKGIRTAAEAKAVVCQKRSSPLQYSNIDSSVLTEEMSATPESAKKKSKIDFRRSFPASLIDEESKIIQPDAIFGNQKSPSNYTTPKRKIWEVYDNRPQNSSAVSVTDQSPYSPLTQTPSMGLSKYSKSISVLPQYDAKELQTLSPGIGFVDTHCHLDFLFKQANHNGSFEAYRKMLSEYFPDSYEGCVAIFCDPSTFAQKSVWESIIEENGVWASFGCHPHNAKDYNEEIDEALIQTLSHAKVKALGEIGLDYSSRNFCKKEVQHIVFKRQLKLAVERNLPLVIHCRDAHEDCFTIMKKLVPSDYKIHLHCFTSPWTTATRWLDEYPNLFIGITNVVTFPSAECIHEVAKKIPLDRLLLETDAPYFLPRSLPRSLRWSHPGMAIHVAAQVSALKGDVSIVDVLKVVRKNTQKMYGI